MNISKISHNSYKKSDSFNNMSLGNKQQYIAPFVQKQFSLSESLFALGKMNYVSFKAAQNLNNKKYEINLSSEELRQRCDNLSEYRMLGVDCDQYDNLSDGDKEALKHLVKAGKILDEVYLRQDSIHNIPFRTVMQKQAALGDKDAEMALKLFNAQKGINAKDLNAKIINLAKGYSETPGKGFYPEDLTKEEFHNILINMLNDGEKEEVKKILNQRSIVERDGDKLRAFDYTDYFKDEFSAAADELVQAAQTSTNDDFNKFLLLQADALLTNNPKVDAAADKIWAKLQDTPLEFTITRESYDDRMTPSVTENPTLKKMLDEEGIIPYAKDNIGVRVGIVNKKGTDYILKIKEFMPLLAENMPFNDMYEQSISADDNKQTMVDVDIVDMLGQTGAYRGAISLASNLPNNDKLAVQTGGGKRNVYHVQTRNAKYSNNLQPRLDALLNPAQQKYFDVSALHDFTILHENVHSLGPKSGLENLGVYKNIIEENKADMGAILMLDVLTKNGFYTPLRQKQILTSYIVGYVLKGPDFENAHKKRNIMQHNYFIQNGGITVSEDGVMTINYDKVTELSKKMLEKIIKIQMKADPVAAKKYIDENAVWTEDLDKMAQKLRAVDNTINSRVVSPLADMLASE